MSSGGLDDARFAWDHQIYRYIFLSGLVVLLYDHLLTFGSEVNNIWSCKRRRSKYWFFAIRYITLGCNVPILVFYFGDLSPKA
ncbi:hypothetical protein C8R44DRAFT_868569 [Mycena epipterygia]|nr:hypothetical protein C8R44DRAFT_868569 [Mycena epipterygia]